MGFFDVTPLGRIMNRFSSDVYSVDDSLPFLLNILLAQTYALIGTVVVCCYGLPWIILVLIPLGAAYYVIQVSVMYFGGIGEGYLEGGQKIYKPTGQMCSTDIACEPAIFSCIETTHSFGKAP